MIQFLLNLIHMKNVNLLTKYLYYIDKRYIHNTDEASVMRIAPIKSATFKPCGLQRDPKFGSKTRH